MRSRTSSKKPIWVISIIAIYVFVSAAGIFLISYFPLARMTNSTFPETEQIASYYAAGRYDDIVIWDTSFNHIFIYDTDQVCQLYLHLTDEDQVSTDIYTEHFSPRMKEVLEGKNLIYISRNFVSDNILHLWVIEAAPVRTEGLVSGVVFTVDHMENIQESVLAYIAFFTIMYWIFIISMSVLRKKREELDVMKNVYINNVTHSLKTPASAIQVIVENLSENDNIDFDPEKRHIYYGMILHELSIHNNIVNDMLSLSKVQGGIQDTPKSEVSFGPIRRELLEKYENLCEYRGINFCMTEETDFQDKLYTRSDQLKQIFELLIENAMKFTDEGGKIIVDAVKEKHQVVFSVSDDGCGIPQEDVPHIFERFYKGNGAQNKNGSGLGLAIVKESLEALGETIRAESIPGQNTTFFFTIHFR